MLQQRNSNHNIVAWYFAPIIPTPNTNEELTWDLNPIPFYCADISKTRIGLNLLSSYNVTSDDSVIETDSDIDFQDKGKVGFGRIEPKIETASKIKKDGISSKPTEISQTLGSRFTNQIERKTIILG